MLFERKTSVTTKLIQIVETNFFDFWFRAVSNFKPEPRNLPFVEMPSKDDVEPMEVDSQAEEGNEQIRPPENGVTNYLKIYLILLIPCEPSSILSLHFQVINQDGHLEDEEGGIHIDGLYIAPPPPPALTFDNKGPRLIITHIECHNFKSYAGTQVLNL